jgi:hypothetical protein
MSLTGVAPWLSANLGPVLQTRLPLGALLQAQWKGGVFGRYDVLLRSVVAQQLLRDKPPSRATTEISWYNTMQSLRANKDTLATFTDLARAVRDVGLDPDFPIGISPRGSLLDGAHRFAIALARNEATIAVDVRLSKRLRPFERRWFVEAGLPEAALVAMDTELDRTMAHTGVDTILITPRTSEPVRTWLPPLLPAGMKVVREWSVSLSEGDASELERIMREIPWHEKASKRLPASRELPGGALEVVRLRLAHHQLERIKKTATARDLVAAEFEGSLREAIGRVALVGQTYQHNRGGLNFLAGHGWHHQAGTTWQ